MTKQKKLQTEIRTLVKQKKAILLAHNYQPAEIQDVADLTGDSLALSVEASHTDAEVIVFCGVKFMAETAAVLCPNKLVLLPRPDAGCEMADMIDAVSLRKKKESLPGLPVVTYVNSTAEVKAESDICCTSANAIKIVESLIEPEILMVPDRNLALYAQQYSTKKIHLWDGYCPVHDKITSEHIRAAKKNHPEAIVVAHPECRPEVTQMADEVCSTTGMLSFVKKSRAGEFIIATEAGMLYPLRKENPSKLFHSVSDNMTCPHMKVTKLEDVILCLLESKNPVIVAENIRRRAKKAVDRMLAVPRN